VSNVVSLDDVRARRQAEKEIAEIVADISPEFRGLIRDFLLLQRLREVAIADPEASIEDALYLAANTVTLTKLSERDKILTSSIMDLYFVAKRLDEDH